MVPSSRRRTMLSLITGFVLVLTWYLAGCATVSRSHRTPITPVAGAATPTIGPDAYERSGRTPQLRLTLPPATSPRPFPLVVALHSLANDGREPQAKWGIDALAASAGVAVAYPDGLDKSWDAGTCCGQAAAEHVDDVGWLRALISHLEQHYPIDRHRVILVGFSNGGMLAYRYACEHPSEIAGIAVVAASRQITGCTPAAPIGVVAVHGQLDERVPYEGTAWSDVLGASLTSVEDSLKPFRARAGCPSPPQPDDSVRTDADGVPTEDAAGGQATPTPTAPATAASPAGGHYSATRKETSCSSDQRVVEFLLPGVAHGWPPSSGPAQFNTAEVLWRLLAPMRSHRAGPNL
ncbi:alpha/beta hydrolase family esterase [Frankia sp. Cas4]|uniref:alpha/beta hydrolase family esterase n=1 Tax=Frankia sp. Cas4 TaxID=3073927 RepID=UPI002AD54A7B|nr:alpha/beta fold hydrolase [Frankia sp. Cas4]